MRHLADYRSNKIELERRRDEALKEQSEFMGERCLRDEAYPSYDKNESVQERNPMHRTELAHPGDSDYRRPSYPEPPLGTPDCPYGDQCYRRNPVHFQQFAHPPSTDFEKNYRLRKRKLKQQAKKKANQLADDYDHEDDFIDDDDDDEGADFSSDDEDEYVPSDSDYDDTEEM